MSHVERFLARRFSVVVATAFCALIVIGMTSTSYAGDNDGIGGFKYKIKMEGDEESVGFGGTDLLLTGTPQGSGAPESQLIEYRVQETRTDIAFAKFLVFLIMRR
jgi:hypothetical protein